MLSVVREDYGEFDFGFPSSYHNIHVLVVEWSTYSSFYFVFSTEFSGGDTTPIGRPSFSYSGKLFWKLLHMYERQKEVPL